ncbi:MAG: DUF3750 domain-containing protein [Acidiferrobacterales bacterium]|nr:DUF3750 domain-containing protein [Acidiferrobacterales bacterium]
MKESTCSSGKKRSWLLRSLLAIFALYIVPVSYQLAAYHFEWKPAIAWASVGRSGERLAQDPSTTDDAIIQVYAARAMRWRGALGVHTWIAVKKSNQDFYTRLDVMGYALRWSDETVQIRRGQPDRYWYGNEPELLRELRGGDEVDAMIDDIFSIASSYQYNSQYSVWPGPNSNTFVAHLVREIPALSVDLPPTAVGKDYLPGNGLINTPASGKGLQLSISGLLGIVISPEEGLELNLLGMTAGIDLFPPAIKLPGVGRVGMRDSKRLSTR